MGVDIYWTSSKGDDGLQYCSNNVTLANEFSREIGTKKFKKICSNYLTPAGIVRGNDVFLYGEKVKAYLRAGARPLRGEGEVPNDRVGFGAVCVENSLPG